jgi:hypothetical protein
MSKQVSGRPSGLPAPIERTNQFGYFVVTSDSGTAEGLGQLALPAGRQKAIVKQAL